MIGWLLRYIVGLIVGFALILGVIVGQPRDDAAMRAFFAPPGCDAPCFLGIRPGVTSRQQAVDLLSAHPWIRRVVDASGSASIFWTWSDQAPKFFAPLSPQSRPYLYIRQDVVQFIQIPTYIPYGSVQLILGAPATGVLTRQNPNASDLSYIHTAGYLDGQITFAAAVVCPFSPAMFWRADTTVTYSDGSITAYTMPPYDLIDQLYRRVCDP